MIQDCGLECTNSSEYWIVGNQAGGESLHRGSGLQGVRRPQAMQSAESRCNIRDFQAGGNPLELRIGRKQSIDFVGTVQIAPAIRLHQQFRHRDGGGQRRTFWALDPGEDRIRKRQVACIRLQLGNKDAGIERDSTVPAEKGSEPIYSQLWRSFCRCRLG